MTALAGRWSFHCDAADDLSLGAMLQAQSAFGSGEPRGALSGPVAFGRWSGSTVGRCPCDSGPLRGGGGALLLVADVRLDNREELAFDLGLAAEAEAFSDRTLLLSAWERWEERTLDRLVGAWAFALWDARAHRLLLARDPQGQRPLHYHVSETSAAFASMPCGLHALSHVPRALDRETLGRFVDRAPLGPSRSFFDGVSQVPPGHLVSIGRAGVRTTRYWQPSLEPIRFKAAADYADAVREQLDRAVRACLRGAGPVVGAHLSAGLDSGGVAASAARLLGPRGTVLGFTSVPRPGSVTGAGGRAIVDEGPLAAATAALHPNLRQVRVHRAGSVVAGLGYGARLYEQPLPNPCNHDWASAILQSARDRGVCVLLTGQVGNLTFSHDGDELLPTLLRSGRWLRFAREAVLLRRAGFGLRSLAGMSASPLLPSGVARAIRRALAGSSPRPAARLTPDTVRSDTDQMAGPPDLAATRQRLWALEHYDFGNFNAGILAGWGIEVRDPTSDRRLVELCLRIPPEQFLSGGVRRALARRVLADRLPPAVLNETRRGQQSADWPDMLDRERAEILDEVRLIATSPAASGVIDVERLQALVDAWPARWDGAAHAYPYRTLLLRALSAGRFARDVEAAVGLVGTPGRSRAGPKLLLD